MNKPQPDCPHCQERMVDGYLLDLGNMGYRPAPQWVEGSPQMNALGLLSIKDHERHSAVTFRRPTCGLLLEYAF